MASRANYVKIGLFVILGLVGALGLAVALGARSGHRDTIAFYTYFNESVQGLDVGAPVTFRGVRTGSVSGITIAPDHRMVEVRTDIDAGAMERLGIWPKEAFRKGLPVPPPPPDLRAQLGSQGLTGVRFVAIDFFDPKTNPPPTLSFPVPAHYVPAATSLSKGLEDSVTKAMETITTLGDVTVSVVTRVDGMVADLQRRHAGDEAGKAIAEADTVLHEVDRTVKGLNRSHVAETVGDTLDTVRYASVRLGKLLEGLDGDSGLIAAAQRALVAIDGVGQNLTGGTQELYATLTEFREAAAAIRRLADELDREPDVLVKGRAGGGSR
jgi:phospholipid/cholesterol/gamma-HCH transport system substrate-binding protein